jgi:hypothetical protein
MVEPFAGDVTFTPAKAAGAQIASKHTISNKDFGILRTSPNVVLLASEQQNCTCEASPGAQPHARGWKKWLVLALGVAASSDRLGLFALQKS